MASRSRSPSLSPDGSSVPGCLRESLPRPPRDVPGGANTGTRTTYEWNAGAQSAAVGGAGYVSLGGVRYGVRLAADKYSAGPRRALSACCGQSRAACCRARQARVRAKPDLPACLARDADTRAREPRADCRSSGRRGDTTDCQSTRRQGDTADCHSRRQEATADSQSSRPQGDTADYQSSRTLQETEDGSLLQDTNSCLPISRDTSASSSLQGTSSCLYRSKDAEESFCLQDTSDCCPRRQDTSESLSLQETASGLPRSKDTTKIFSVKDTNSCLPRSQTTYFQDANHCLPRSQDTSGSFSLQDTNSCSPRSQATSLKDRNSCSPRTESLSSEDTVKCFRRNHTDSGSHKNTIGCLPRSESLSSEDTVNCFPRNHPDSGSNKDTFGCLPRNPCSSGSLSSEDTVKCLPRSNADSGYLSREDTIKCLPRSEVNTGSLSRESSTSCLTKSGQLPCEDTAKCLPKSPSASESLCHRDKSSCLPKSQTESGSLSNEDTIKCLPRSHSRGGSLSSDDTTCSQQVNVGNIENACNKNSTSVPIRNASYIGNLCNSYKSNSHQNNIKLGDLFHPDSSSSQQRNTPIVGSLCKIYTTNSPQRSPVNLGPFNNKGTYTTNGSDVNNKEALTYYNRSPSGSVNNGSHNWANAGVSNWTNSGPSSLPEKGKEATALDRLQRFRFGGRSASSGERKARPDKTERLRELTDRLRGKPPPPLPPPRLHRQPRSTPEPPTPPQPPVEDTFDPLDCKVHRAEARTIVGSYAQRTIPFRSASFSQVDFNAIDGKYIRSDPKLIPRNPTSSVNKLQPGGTIICEADLTLPRKKETTSRSLVKESAVDIGSTPSVDSAVGSDEGLNSALSRIPTVVPDLSHKPAGARSLTHPLPGRSSSVDGQLSYSSSACDGRKSLQYFPNNEKLREVREESDVSLADSAQAHSDNFSPVDGSLGNLCAFDFPIPVEQKNESERLSLIRSESDDKGSDIKINVTPECSRAQIFIETPEGKVLKTATASVIPVPVYECIVREWSSIPSEQWLENKGEKAPDIEMIDRGPEAEDKKFRDRNFLEAPDDETITSEQVENLLASVQNASKLPPSAPEEKKHVLDKSKRRKGIYITKWPIHDEISGLILPESVISAQFNEDVPNGEVVNLETGDREVFIGNNVNSDNGNNKNINRSRTLSGNLSYLKTDSAKKPGDSVRWTGQDSACIWSAPQDEPLSPEIDERSPPQWPKSLTEPRWNSRPALTYQSSEEKEDYGVPKVNNKKISLLARADSLSEGESECGSLSTPVRDRTASPSPFNPSDLSDNESRSQSTKDRGTHVPRRYSKRPLRGPYGQMLEAEMKKPELCKLSKHDEELKFLDDLVASPPLRPRSPDIASSRSSLTSSASVGIPEPRITVTRTRGAGNHSLDDTHLKSSFGLSSSPTQKPMIRASPKRKVSANIPYSAPNPVTSPSECVNRGVVFHQRTTSSPSKLEGFSPRLSNEVKKKPEPSVELLAELLRGSSERLSADASLDRIPFQLQRFNDTRTHVVVELYDTERSYVEALQILVVKYLHPLKSPENVGLVDAALVDEIFFQVPAILALHEVFLEELRRRLELWDVKQKVGDVFLNVFTKPSVMEMYTGFINNWKKAKETIKATSSSRPAFARFLEAMARDHKGKLSLDNLLIKPVQKFPRYELLIQRLIKHTEPSHPDHQLLIDAQKEIHELLVRINCTERESLELEQQQQTLRELESLVEGLANLVAAERSFLRHDTVSMPSGQGATKERALFLFSDLLLITSIKRRTGTIRKPSSVSACPGSLASTLDANKYKLLMRISLDDLEILKAKDENLRRIMREMETLSEDVSTLTQIGELTASLHCGRGQLEELVREMLQGLARQLAERQGSDAQLAVMELALNTSNGIENLSIIFSKPEKRTSWEEIFNEAKQKIALSDDKRPAPEFVTPVPIRKTRAGLQFTCAAPTLALAPNSTRDVWVCNSDGYVGQVCVLTLHPEPQVTSCNGVCNARILCVACIPPPPPAKAPSPVPPTVEATNNAGSNRQNFSNSKTGISISIQDADDGNQNIRLESSSSSEDDDEGSSAGENPNENQPLGNNTNNSATSNPAPTTGVQNNQNKSGSNAQNIPVNPVMKSSSNPNVDKTAMGITTGTASPKQSIDESSNCNQPTMWLGTEDGCIHVYNCSDNIRIKKNKIKIQHGSGVHCIVYVDNRIFVSLANGDIIVYVRDNGGWKEHTSITVGTVSCPVTRLLLSGGKLWCAQYTNVKIINPNTVQVEDTITVSNDPGKPISHIAISGVGVWVALSNAAVLKCFHANTKEMLTELNIAPAVTKMLAGCDDIIRQHKAACLRVTSLLACRELLWIGTSAGVLLTAPAAIPNPPAIPTLCGVPQGHTGHVRFLTVVEASSSLGSLTANLSAQSSNQKQSLLRRSIHSPGKLKSAETSSAGGHLLVISGGDGYEDFRSSGVSEIAGREDSTNHLLLWRV